MKEKNISCMIKKLLGRGKEKSINSEKTLKLKKKNMIIGFVVGGISILILLAYIGTAVYFKDRFYFNTTINGINCTGKTVEEVESLLKNMTEDYQIEINGREDIKDVLKASDIRYKYVPDGSVQKLKESQNPYGWIGALIGGEMHTIKIHTTFERDAFQNIFKNLSVLKEENVRDPQDAYVTFVDGNYQIAEEVQGNYVSSYVLYEKLIQAIRSGERKVVLEDIDAYQKPEYTKESEELIDLKERLEEATQVNIVYDFGESQEIVDRTLLNEWVSYNQFFGIDIRQEEIRAYIENLAELYDTYNKPRDFVTNDDSVVTVKATRYGWEMDTEEEIKHLTEDIFNGTQEEREPAYKHTAVSRENSDLGNTYVEVDMTNQHVWYYLDGEEVVSTDVVTGNIRAGHRTPEGTFKLYYKQRNTVLRGEDYASPVKYWMPFNGGIGLHDASWRGTFGGEIYKTRGSHGCINMPTQEAGKLYENITAETPVICYYRE
jgi:hypothetical protein